MNIETFKSLRKDIACIVYCLCAPEPQDDSEAEFERFEEVCADQAHYGQKYGDEVIDRIRTAIHDIPNQVGGTIHE